MIIILYLFCKLWNATHSPDSPKDLEAVHSLMIPLWSKVAPSASPAVSSGP